MAYAICPYCSKNIAVQEGSLQEYKCASCGNTLTVAFLREKDAFIDVDASNIEYQTGKQHFDEGDFNAAGECCKRALRFNPNNYLAEYFSGICEISLNEGKDDFSVPKALSKAFLASVIKADNAQIEPSYKAAFISTVLNEMQIMLISQMDKYIDRYDNLDCQKIFRAKCVDYIAAVNEMITSIDSAFLMLSDNAVASMFRDIVDSAVEICFKATHAFAAGFDYINAVTDAEFAAVQKYYETFMAFLKSIDKKYKCAHKINFEDNITYNKDVWALVEKYYDVNKDNRKAKLSITGDFLENMTRQCMTAIRLTYLTCVRNIGIVKNDNVRNELINQALKMGFEILKPRLFLNNKHRVCAVVKNTQQMHAVTEFMDLLAPSLSDSGKKTAADTYKNFYDNVLSTVKTHYTSVNLNYQKTINKLKRAQNEEYAYYLGFLFDMSMACSVALSGISGYVRHKMKPRIALLKLCRKICEEFLLLTDYKVESIEKSRFKEIITIYGAIDNDIVFLAKM